MSVLAEKKKTPRKTQKNNNLKNNKYQNVNYGGPVFTFSLQGGWLAPCPSVSYATAGNPIREVHRTRARDVLGLGG